MNAIATSPRTTLRHITDWLKFTKLPEAAQADVLMKLDGIDQLLTAKHRTKVQVRNNIAKARGVSPATISNELKAFKTHGWEGLVDNRRFGSHTGKLPQIYKQSIIGDFEGHQRTDDAAEVRRKQLDKLALWRRTGNPQYALPGYDCPPEDNPALGYPDGWSEKTFERMKDEGYTRYLNKQGKKAASAFLPSVLTTREGSRYLERVYFDDQDYDNKIIVAGLSESVRPVGFNCLDHLTGAHLGYHLRVVTKAADEQTNKALTGKEFTWFSLHKLQTVGYRTDERGTTHVYEHGTANSWNNKKLTTFSGHTSYEEALFAITNGCVKVERSGKFNDPSYAGMIFAPQSAGNFRFKTWIETAFRLVRTYMQALPGSVGRKYELAPEELYGIEREEKKLLTAMAGLPPAIADKMQHEMLTYVEFAEILRAVYRAINARRDHNLEAWEQCGFTRVLWRMNEESNFWHPREELEQLTDQDEKAYMLRKVGSNPKLIKTEYLSPAEAVQMSCNDPAIKKLGREVTPLLIPREWAIEKTVKSEKVIKLQDPFHKKTYHQYVCQIQTREGRITLNTGTEILCYYNPFDIDNLVICNREGAYLGTLTRTIPRQTHDQEATLTQLEQRAMLRSDLEAAPRARAATIMEERQQEREHNRRLINGEETDPTIRRQQKASKSSAKRFGRHLSPAQTPTIPDAEVEEDWSDQPVAETPSNNTQEIEEQW